MEKECKQGFLVLSCSILFPSNSNLCDSLCILEPRFADALPEDFSNITTMAHKKELSRCHVGAAALSGSNVPLRCLHSRSLKTPATGDHR